MASSLFRGSEHALLYSKFRPSPPQEFITSIITYLRSKIHGTLKQGIDIGCGSGQSTIILAPYFEKVIGFDVSEAQIECARKERSAINVEYRISNCKKLPLPSTSVQLATLSQAIHWFNTTELFTEVKRVLVPNGVIAVYGYWIPLPAVEDIDKNKKISHLISKEFHDRHLGKYWDIERYTVLKKYYAGVILPFKDIQRLDITQKSETTLADYIGYLSTWSAYQKLCLEDGEKGKTLLEDIKKECISILDPNKSSEEIIFKLHTDFFMLMGHC